MILVPLMLVCSIVFCCVHGQCHTCSCRRLPNHQYSYSVIVTFCVSLINFLLPTSKTRGQQGISLTNSWLLLTVHTGYCDTQTLDLADFFTNWQLQLRTGG